MRTHRDNIEELLELMDSKNTMVKIGSLIIENLITEAAPDMAEELAPKLVQMREIFERHYIEKWDNLIDILVDGVTVETISIILPVFRREEVRTAYKAMAKLQPALMAFGEEIGIGMEPDFVKLFKDDL